MPQHTIVVALLAALAAPACAAECSNGLLEGGETCAACPADCKVEACTPAPPTRTVALSFAAPHDTAATGATLLLAYRSRLLSLPGAGAEGSVRNRVKDTPANAVVAVNDRDYALRIVIARGTGIPSGKIATVEFDSCQGAPPATTGDFACVVEGCATTFGTVDDCTCTVAVQPR